MSRAIDKPVRILHVLQRMEAGGTQALLMNMYRRIDRTKLQFDFLVEYPDRQFYDDEIEQLGGHVYHTNVRNNANILAFTGVLRHLIEEYGYRIVHMHTYSIGYFCLREAERCGVPVRIAHSHNNQTTKGLLYVPKLIMQKLYTIHANRFMACSEDAGRYLFGDRRFMVVKNAIDVDSFRYSDSARCEARAELGIPDDDFVVGNVGRLCEQKNQLFLLGVVQKLKASVPSARLLIVGSGPLKEEILSCARRLGIDDSVMILENRHDMTKIYQAMDVFAFPSLFEGLGIAAIEAQAAGLPTLCSDGVAEDADASPSFHRLPANATEDDWEKAISNIACRGDACDAGSRSARSLSSSGYVREAGFDAAENAKAMERWYLDQLGVGNWG